MSLILECRSLSKCHDTRAGRSWALRNISFEVTEGEFVSVVGPSGSGKSTLLGILGLLDTQFDGLLRFLGRDVSALSSRARQDLARAHIGFIFQHYHLLGELTVEENLDVPLSYRRLARAERRQRIDATLERFGLSDKRDRFPAQLSGGQQQLVAVARALIAHPLLILADEPTGALHSSHGHMIMRLVAELNAEGTTVVQVTHSMEHARYGWRTLELFDGWISPAETAPDAARTPEAAP